MTNMSGEHPMIENTKNLTPSLSKGKTKPSSRIVLFIGSDILGRGEDSSLGSLLLQKFLHTIPGLAIEPETIVFINNGVKLVVKGSEVLGDLQVLESRGIKLLACGTCLSRFELIDKVKVSKISDMYTIAETMFEASKVIAL